jgi:ERF superfamily
MSPLQLSLPAETIYRSIEINEIMGALAKAQGSYKKLVANQDAPGGKFANLQAILDAVRESLSKNGLGFFQFIELLDEGSGAALLKTTIGHESGQYISSCARVVTGKTERQTGNIYEIHKRLHALMLLGIAPSDNDPIAFDDNGEIMAEQHLVASLRKPDSPQKEEIDRSDVINKHQYEELLIELNGFDKIAKDIMQAYDIHTLADLPASEYHRARAKILKIKRTQEDYLRKK